MGPDATNVATHINAKLRVVFLLVALSATIFWVDWLLPLGVAAGVLYVAVVLVAMWLPGRRSTVWVAAGCSILVVLGFVISEAEGTPWMVMVNRFLALFVIWAAAYLSTGRIRAMQNQREADERLKAVMMTAAEGIISMDSLGVIETFNTAAEKIFGFSIDEVVGQNVKMLMPFPYAMEHDGYLTNYHETGVAKVIGKVNEVEGQRKDGTLFPMDLAVSKINIGGEVMFVGIVRDISERKKAEVELEHSRLSLEMAQQIAKMGSWEWVIPSGKISWTDEIFSIFGLSKEEHSPTYDGLMNAVHPDDRTAVKTALELAVKGDVPYQVEHRVVRPDGSERLVVEQGEVYRDDAGRPILMICTVQDITEQYQAQEKLLAAEEKLGNAEIAKAELEGIHKVTATLAHEINNPLAGIVGMLQMLREEAKEGGDTHGMLQETLVAAKRIKAVILKMEALNRPEFKDYLGKAKIIDLDKSK